MNGHVRKRGKSWEVVLELGEQTAQRCPACTRVQRVRRRRKDGTITEYVRERGTVQWAGKGRLAACPSCGGELEDVTARRQVVLPERFRTKREAQEAKTTALHASLHGVFVDPQKITLGEYLTEHWLPSIEESVRATTLLSYRGHVDAYLVPMLGDVPLHGLSPTSINAFHAKLREAPRRPRRKPREDDAGATDMEPLAPLSERTRLHIHVTLNAALNAAVRQGLLAVNPAGRATAPRPARRAVTAMHTWTDAELRTFLAAVREDRHYALWRLLAHSGMRRGEALGLKWSDVDLPGGRVAIQRARVMVGYQPAEQPPKTPQSRRAVSLDRGTIAVLRAWKAAQAAERLAWGAAWADTGYVFTAEDGVPLHPDRVTKLFNKAVKAAGVPRIRLHDLRHTSATLALAAGIHPKIVQERLGHATISQTLDTYSHTTPTLHEDAAAKLGALMGGDS